MNKLIRYTLFVDGEKITSHLAEQFAGTSLQKAQQMLLKEKRTRYRRKNTKHQFRHTACKRRTRC